MSENVAVQKVFISSSTATTLGREIWMKVNLTRSEVTDMRGALQALKDADQLVSRTKAAGAGGIVIPPTGGGYVSQQAAKMKFRQNVAALSNFFALNWSLGPEDTEWTASDVEGLIPQLGQAEALNVMSAALSQAEKYLTYTESYQVG